MIDLKAMRGPDKEVSIAGDHYRYPIADLVYKLTRCKRNSINPDIPLNVEVDYSIAVILLLVLMVESYLARIRHFDKKTTKKRNALDYFSNLQGCKRLALKFREVHLLRNAIAHNHVYEYEHYWDLTTGEHQFRNFQIDYSWQGDSSNRECVKLSKQGVPKTRLLGLRIVPTMIGREEVLKVFDTVYQVLLQLQRKRHLDLDLSIHYVPYKSIENDKTDLSFSFWDLIEEIRKVTK
ncbi:MAG: hypothetical protein HYZ46_01205 [Nitrosomonadales bacterium]|nr:hypothetical protein [Nitrosomonadales bacterium]